MNGPAAPAVIGDALADVDTPALLLDLDVFEANLRAVHGLVAASGLALRSHGKAHKCSAIGRLQVEAGAVGLCCQKVGEAEAFVDGGIRDVLVSNVIVGAGKAQRLARRTAGIIRQNLIFALGAMVLLVIGGLFFNMPLPLAVLGHEGGTVLVVLNGLRLLADPIRGRS